MTLINIDDPDGIVKTMNQQIKILPLKYLAKLGTTVNCLNSLTVFILGQHIFLCDKNCE